MRKFLSPLFQLLSHLSTSKWGVPVLVSVAAITRTLGVILSRGRGDLADDGDGAYIIMAKNFLETGRLFFDHPEYGRMFSWLPPGMAMLDIGYFSIFGMDMSFYRVLFILMSVTANVCLFYAAKRLYEPVFAYAAALLWALYPAQWFWASRMNPNNYATNMVIICLLLLFIAWEKRSIILSFVVGLLWVTASLCRGEYVLGIFALAFATWFVYEKKKLSLLVAMALLGGWVAGLSPWVIRNYSIHHRFVLIGTNDGYNMWKAYNEDYNFSGVDIPVRADLLEKMIKAPNEVVQADILKDDAKRFIRERPGRALRNVAGNMLHFWRPWLSPESVSLTENVVYIAGYLPLFLLFIIGVVLMPKRNPYFIAVGGLILYKWLIHSLFYVIVRFREAIMPLIGMVAVLPVRYLMQKEADHRN